MAALGYCNHLAEGQDPVSPRFWVKDIQAELARIEPGVELNDSTVNRALKRFVASGWLSASWETADAGDPLSSKPRLYFRFTEAGLSEVRAIVARRRLESPLWVLFPTETVGEPSDDPRMPLALRKPNPASEGSSTGPVYHQRPRRKRA